MLQNLYNYVIIITFNYNQCEGYLGVYCILAMFIVFGIFYNKDWGIGEREKAKKQELILI